MPFSSSVFCLVQLSHVSGTIYFAYVDTHDSSSNSVKLTYSFIRALFLINMLQIVTDRAVRHRIFWKVLYRHIIDLSIERHIYIQFLGNNGMVSRNLPVSQAYAVEAGNTNQSIHTEPSISGYGRQHAHDFD